MPGIHNGKSLRADEKLRKQMLGKNANRPISGVKVNVNVTPKPRPAILNRSAESDEEEGRSSLGKAKRPKKEQVTVVEVSQNESGEAQQSAVRELAEPVLSPGVATGKQLPGSYLDDIRSKRSTKKRRKKESR